MGVLCVRLSCVLEYFVFWTLDPAVTRASGSEVTAPISTSTAVAVRVDLDRENCVLDGLNRKIFLASGGWGATRFSAPHPERAGPRQLWGPVPSHCGGQ